MKSTPATDFWNARTTGRKTAPKSAGAETHRHTAVANPVPTSETLKLVPPIISANTKTAQKNTTKPAVKRAICGTPRPKPARRNAIPTTATANVRGNTSATRPLTKSATAPFAQPKTEPPSTKDASSSKLASKQIITKMAFLV